MSMVTFTSATTLNNKEMKKVCEPDKDGFYKVLLGGFNVYNAQGELYRFTKAVMTLFKEGSQMRRRLGNGILKAEVDHPDRKEGMTDKEHVERWLSIDPDRVCGIFGEIIQSDVPMKLPGVDMELYPTWGLIKPTGVKANVLKASLEDPAVNTAFSIRNASNRVEIGNKVFRDVIHIITWDHVEEGGIPTSNQLTAARMRGESIDIEITTAMMDSMRRELSSNSSMLTGESKDNVRDALVAIDRCIDGNCIYSSGW